MVCTSIDIRRNPGCGKQKLLVVELWGLGDLAMASPFLQAASRQYEVSLLAKPTALALQPRFWPEVRVVPFNAPWTAFRGKYRLLNWPWREIFRLRRLAGERFDVGLSPRWDPRDHFLLHFLRVQRRLGFPRLQSNLFLTQAVEQPPPTAHRYEYWRRLAQALGLELPPRQALVSPSRPVSNEVVLHTGAAQAVRVWPLERYQGLAQRLRQQGYRVQVVCDPNQRDWWLKASEEHLAVPSTLPELLSLIDRAGAFISNDSGPAHLAALCGVPTFTLFGPQLPERFAPLHPSGEVMEGKPCPHKPCSDYCRFPVPHCLVDLGETEVWERARTFVARVLPKA